MVKVSLEIFPTRSEKAYHNLQEALNCFSGLNPEFLSVTCRSGGKQAHQKTSQFVSEIGHHYPLPLAAHMTCTDMSQKDLAEIADQYWQAGIRHIIALRGDPIQHGPFIPHPGGHRYALDLIKALKARHDFEISCAAYPETHSEAPSSEFDLDILKQKINAGAHQAITQFFFDVEAYLRFRDRAVKAGIHAPLIPGLLPVLNFEKLKNFAKTCQIRLPPLLFRLFDQPATNPYDHYLLAMNVLHDQIHLLMEEGVEQFHFYTLNETMLIKHICVWLKEKFNPGI